MHHLDYYFGQVVLCKYLDEKRFLWDPGGKGKMLYFKVKMVFFSHSEFFEGVFLFLERFFVGN